MATTPPVLIVLDLSTLMGSSTREWQDFSRVGSCCLPQVVYEEIEFLSSRAPEPDLEKTAREFLRFFPNSGWQLTNANASHPALTPPPGQALSKQARLSLAVAQCAYGLSSEHAGELVVLVSTVQQLLQRLSALQSPNLCGIAPAALLQWARTGQKPPAVTQQMGATLKAASTPVSAATASKPASPPKAATSAPMSGPASAARSPASSSRRNSGGMRALSGSIGSVLALVGLAIAGGFAWRAIQPASFDNFWQQLGLPALPGQQPAQKPKPVKK
ncbi:MAG TPA: hypothetical protein DCY88_24460 [Cyanobacteria bacterium UBA11372]|nr:hypothetical protein [Cyanobacteria bacterium UBA11372]